jgi:hypothetical protein
MLRLFSRIILPGVGALLLLFSAVPAATGYVLPGPYLVRMMARGMGTASTLLVDQRQVLFGLSDNGQGQEITETLRYRFPLSLRADVTTAVARRIFIQQGSRQVTVLDGRVVPQADNRLDLYRDLLLVRSRTLLRNRLLRAGIDIEISSLGHDGPEVVYVLGASFPDATPAQLWIDKQRFLPVRWILYPRAAVSAGTQQIEFRFQKWEQLKGGIWYPMRVECYQNEILVREITVTSVRVNEPFEDALFNLEQFKQAAPRPEETPAVGKPSRELEEVQKTIEDFNKIYQ